MPAPLMILGLDFYEQDRDLIFRREWDCFTREKIMRLLMNDDRISQLIIDHGRKNRALSSVNLFQVVANRLIRHWYAAAYIKRLRRPGEWLKTGAYNPLMKD